jgi:hypothetical protein
MNKSKTYKAGDVIPASGIYRVEHESHHLMHEVTLLENTLFPRCRQCKNAVRFWLARAIQGRRLLPFRSSTILEEFDQPNPSLKMAG